VRVSVMQSSGGIIAARVAAEEPVRTILSGPAGGVVGACEVARRTGVPRIITFDMGGTSTDVALVDDAGGGLATTRESEVAGLPVAVPMLSIHTVGAGGGSLARFDAGGALAVGPDSAGADPGPVCYGRGDVPTVTDANLLLGRIGTECFLEGGVKLDAARTRHYFEKNCGPMAGSVALAAGVVRVVEASMERALRVVSMERGFDPRDFTLVAFGGAGPLHACALAAFLRIPHVLIPRFPGALSALGILTSDVVRDYSQTLMLSPGHAGIERAFRQLVRRGAAEMRREQLKAVAARSLDIRYAGQGYEIEVPWGEKVVEHFHKAHLERYGYADERRPVEVVNARVRMIAAAEPLRLRRRRALPNDGARAVIEKRPVYFNGRFERVPVYNRALLRPGCTIAGPAIVAEYSATTVLPPRCSARVDEWDSLVIEVAT
jgi:N-methylhydantoinase A